jgi:hypothetical protein
MCFREIEAAKGAENDASIANDDDDYDDDDYDDDDYDDDNDDDNNDDNDDLEVSNFNRDGGNSSSSSGGSATSLNIGLWMAMVVVATRLYY